MEPASSELYLRNSFRACHGRCVLAEAIDGQSIVCRFPVCPSLSPQGNPDPLAGRYDRNLWVRVCERQMVQYSARLLLFECDNFGFVIGLFLCGVLTVCALEDECCAESNSKLSMRPRAQAAEQSGTVCKPVEYDLRECTSKMGHWHPRETHRIGFVLHWYVIRVW